MKIFQKLKLKLGLIGELLISLWDQKLWWLIPAVIVLIIFGLFLIFAQGTAVIHFVYPIF